MERFEYEISKRVRAVIQRGFNDDVARLAFEILGDDMRWHLGYGAEACRFAMEDLGLKKYMLIGPYTFVTDIGKLVISEEQFVYLGMAFCRTKEPGHSAVWTLSPYVNDAEVEAGCGYKLRGHCISAEQAANLISDPRFTAYERKAA